MGAADGFNCRNKNGYGGSEKGQAGPVSIWGCCRLRSVTRSAPAAPGRPDCTARSRSRAAGGGRVCPRPCAGAGAASGRRPQGCAGNAQEASGGRRINGRRRRWRVFLERVYLLERRVSEAAPAQAHVNVRLELPREETRAARHRAAGAAQTHAADTLLSTRERSLAVAVQAVAAAENARQAARPEGKLTDTPQAGRTAAAGKPFRAPIGMQAAAAVRQARAVQGRAAHGRPQRTDRPDGRLPRSRRFRGAQPPQQGKVGRPAGRQSIRALPPQRGKGRGEKDSPSAGASCCRTSSAYVDSARWSRRKPKRSRAACLHKSRR